MKKIKEMISPCSDYAWYLLISNMGAILILILGPDHLLWNNLPIKFICVQKIIFASDILDEMDNSYKHDQFLV